MPAKNDFSIHLPEKPNGAKWQDPPIVITKLRWTADAPGNPCSRGFTHVFAIPSSGGAPKQITSGDYNHGQFSWSADGKWIYTSTARIPDAEYNMEGGDIYAYSVDDNTVIKQLTNRKGPDTDPVPSPGGKKIAYVGHDWKFQSYTVNHLYLMNPDGSNPKNITASLDRDVRNPHWSWDGKMIYFMVEDHGNSQLYSAEAETGTVKQVTTGTQELGANFTLANNAMIATTRSTPEEPGDIVVLPAYRQAPPTRLTSVNEEPDVAISSWVRWRS